MVPLAILRCKAEERLYLAAKTNPERLGDEWTIARNKDKWKSRQLVLVVTTGQSADEIGYVGLADRGKWTGTHQGDLVVTGLSRLAGSIGFRDMTVPRYLDNTTFSQLVSDGWIGSSGTGTDLIAEQVQACREGKREPIVAFASGQTLKAQKVRERMRG